jgi:diguanylate cyclase (GGDEF)-like protein
MPENEEGQLRPQDISVLVVDDDFSVIEVVEELLKRAGFRVTAVTSGSEANRLLITQEFNVLLADLRMSPVSGWDVIRQAREVSNTEVVVMTGYASLDSSLEALHQRVFDFLQKPVDFPRLERAIRNAANHNVLMKRNRLLTRELSEKNKQLEDEVNKVRSEMDVLATHDELTGLYNYRYLQTLLQREVPRSLRYNHPLSFGMLDLDFFKELNDFHGHTVGNRVLSRVARILEEGIRQSDCVCRFGGEEFAVVLPVTTKLQAEPILKRVCGAIKKERLPIDNVRFLTCSGGLASVPEDAGTVDDLLRLADDALYQAKGRGRDTVVLSSPHPTHPSGRADG